VGTTIDVVENVAMRVATEQMRAVVPGMACSHARHARFVLNHNNLPRGPLILQRTVEPQERTVWRTFRRDGIAILDFESQSPAVRVDGAEKSGAEGVHGLPEPRCSIPQVTDQIDHDLTDSFCQLYL